MTPKRLPIAATAVAVLLVATTSTPAATPLTTTQVASGLSRPVFVTAAPDDVDRLFILEKRGVVRILDLDSGTVLSTPFLDIDALVGGGTSTGDERGLLGLAFHPDYESNGYFFLNYTNNASDTVVARYTVSADPNIADPASALTLLTIDQPFFNHNGGWIDFGPDGYLYVSTGDGGSGGDPGDRAQDITDQLLGKLLRIDVDGDDFPADPGRNYAIPPSNPFVGVTGDDEIWAYGLRNAWRCSFDRGTGDLYLADVGQNAWEEVSFQPFDSPGGENYGWRCYEGLHEFDLTDCDPPETMVFPFHEYSHGLGCSISGGYVYRGCDIPDLRGTYFFADYCSAIIWSLRYDGASVSDFQNRTSELDPAGSLSISSIVSFGQDARGELYIVEQGSTSSNGEIFKVIPAAEPTPFDWDGDGDIDAADHAAFSDCLGGPQTSYIDCGCFLFDTDDDGDVDLDDYDDFQAAFTG